MGQKTSKLSSAELQSIKSSTGFTAKEIKQWHKGFSRDMGGPSVTLNEFIAIHGDFYPFGDCTNYAKYAFDAMDKDGDGSLKFDEFMQGLSIVSKGSPKDKMKYSFRLYDRDKDGKVDWHDIELVITAVYEMLGYKDKAEIEKRCYELWASYGRKSPQDPAIGLDEWVDVGSNGALDIYDGLL